MSNNPYREPGEIPAASPPAKEPATKTVRIGCHVASMMAAVLATGYLGDTMASVRPWAFAGVCCAAILFTTYSIGCVAAIGDE